MPAKIVTHVAASFLIDDSIIYILVPEFYTFRANGTRSGIIKDRHEWLMICDNIDVLFSIEIKAKDGFVIFDCMVHPEQI